MKLLGRGIIGRMEERKLATIFSGWGKPSKEKEECIKQMASIITKEEIWWRNTAWEWQSRIAKRTTSCSGMFKRSRKTT